MDFFKALLVFGMILAHTIQLAMHTENQVLLVFSRYINLVTFSGFLFSFGYVSRLAYLEKSRAAIWRRLLRNFLATLLAYYISAAALWAFPLLAAGEPLQLRSLLRILFFVRIQGYSEFLLSFAMLNVFVYCFFGLIQRALHRNWLFFLILACCALSTFIDYSKVTLNLLGVFIGTTEFNAFPILQYFPYYLIGARLAGEQEAQKNKKAFLAVSLCCTGAFFLYTALRGLPFRFPPSLPWVIGGSFFIALYYLLAEQVEAARQRLPAPFVRCCTFVGRNTLYFLLYSNLLLFAWWAFARPIESTWLGLGAGLCCLALTALLVWGTRLAQAKCYALWARRKA